jgi:hypothetical protein
MIYLLICANFSGEGGSMISTGARMGIGTIVRSESHVRYTCQIYGPGEVAAPPDPADYGFGSFVRVPLRVTPARAGSLTPLPRGSKSVGGEPTPLFPDALEGERPAEAQWAVGLIFDTLLVNPAFGTLGPRLSNEEQVALFSPDYLSERAVLVSILLLGTLVGAGRTPRVTHGIPPQAPDLGAEVSALGEEDVRAFHSFADGGLPGGTRPYLHMGYLPHAVAQQSPLLPLAMLRTIERLERLFPENAALLSIVKRNFAWRLKVESAG